MTLSALRLRGRMAGSGTLDRSLDRTGSTARNAAAYRRIVLRQRRRGLRVASLVAIGLAALSLTSRAVLDPIPLVFTLDALLLAAMTALHLSVGRLAASRLWMVAALLGFGGVVTPAAALAIGQADNSLYAIGTVGMAPVALAVFAAWRFSNQVRWSIGATALLLLVTVPAAHGDAVPIVLALWRAWILGIVFGLAAARLFELARLALYRSARLAHSRRSELVAANRRARQAVARMEAVESIGAALTEQGVTPDALDLVVGILADDLGYSHPAILLGDGRGVRLGAQRGYVDPVVEIGPGNGVIGRALTEDRPQFVPDVRTDPDYRAAAAGIRSQIAVPLRANGLLIGILNVESRTELEPSDVASITIVADRVAVALDVADRHRTLESIVDGTPLAIVAYDRSERVRFWGTGAERMFGWRAADVTGRPSPFLDSIDPATDPAFRTIIAGDRVDGAEAERRHRDGHQIPVRIFAASFRDSPGGGQVVAYQDLTRERRTETALAHSEARYEMLVESLQEGVVLQDADGAIVSSNPAADRMLRLRHDPLTGRATRNPLLSMIREDGSSIAARERPAAIARRTGRPVTDMVLGVQAPSGDVTWISTTAIPVQAGSSPAGGVVVSFGDVTERQRLQTELLQAQKMDSVGRLAGGIAHDFNNLLTAILGNSEMLESIVEGEAAEHVEEIRRAAERAAELTRQLLGFARKTMLDPGDHGLNTIVTEMEPMIRRLVGAHIAVVTRLDPAVGHVRVDRSQMDQVLLNLALNARDAMADGGILAIETRVVERADLDPAVVVAADRIAILTVRDSGIGMDENVRRHAFDPFYTTKPRGRGTGLGLATTHGIVIQSGGAITVDSRPGDGSAFAIYLPEVEPVAIAPVVPKDAPGAVCEGTILLVEDEDAVRDVARRILERAGFRVLHAPNASAAMSVIGSGLADIDVLVSDVVMPGLRGPAMYELLRQSAPNLPAVFVSGYADLADETDSLPTGSRFLAKPYIPADLIRIVQAALAERAA
jgi:PAS domain S-box-containing protein